MKQENFGKYCDQIWGKKQNKKHKKSIAFFEED